MTYRDGHAVRDFLRNHPSRDQILRTFALAVLVRRATFPANYAADARWERAVVPSSAGKQLLDRISGHGIPLPDRHLALFGLFSYEDILVEPERCDLDTIQQIIESEAKRFSIRWPTPHGRQVYDRYRSMFDDNEDSLKAEDVAKLLQDTPQGVYQVGHLVTGPLGITTSLVARHFPPRRHLGLWHCPKLDCGALHHVVLNPPQIPLVEAYAQLDKLASHTWQTESHWQDGLASQGLENSESWPIRSALPTFIGDCLVGADRAALFIRALASSHAEALRPVLEAKAGQKARGRPEAIASSLTEDEQLQVLLTLSDGHLKRVIDDLVWAGEIIVPPDEVRQIDPYKLVHLGIYERGSLELSTLGMRDNRHNALLLLRHLTLQAYEGSHRLDLDWLLKKSPEQSTDEALMAYLRIAKPPNAIDRIILTSPRVTRFFADALNTTIEMPDERARQVLAWKLGFDLPREDRRSVAARRALDVFAETLSQIDAPSTDAERHAIRSAGVNAFVEFEGLLDELVSYVAWLLVSDHPKVTRFVYSRTTAMGCVAAALGEELAVGSDSVRWNPNGNALGTSLRYLQRLRNWIAELLESDRTALSRESGEVHPLPKDSPRTFPFGHNSLWADLNPDGLSGLRDAVDNCVATLASVDVANTRNGLEHYREPNRFPTTLKITSTVEAMRSLVEFADTMRLIPKLYWRSSESVDSFGQRTIEMVDSNNAKVLLHSPRTVIGLAITVASTGARPVVVAPGNLFGLPNADLLFSVRQDSNHSRYWNEYPARRTRLLSTSDQEKLDSPINAGSTG